MDRNLKILHVSESFGWSGGAVGSIEEYIKAAGITLAQPGIGIKYFPDEKDVKSLYQYGIDFAAKIKS